jgi:tetratricopeptide (TPR) repeat protein
MALAREQGFPSLLSAGTIRQGWALAAQGQIEEGLAQMHQGVAARRTTGAELAQPYFLALQAEVYGKMGQREQALALLTEALAAVYTTGERRLEAELYRLKGELLLQFKVEGLKSKRVASESKTGPKQVQGKSRPVKTSRGKSKVQGPKSKAQKKSLRSKAKSEPQATGTHGKKRKRQPARQGKSGRKE